MTQGKVVTYLSIAGFVSCLFGMTVAMSQEHTIAEAGAWGDGFAAGLCAGFVFLWMAGFFMGLFMQDVENDKEGP